MAVCGGCFHAPHGKSSNRADRSESTAICPDSATACSDHGSTPGSRNGTSSGDAATPA